MDGIYLLTVTFAIIRGTSSTCLPNVTIYGYIYSLIDTLFKYFYS